VRVSLIGRIGGTGGCPGVRAGIVSPASVQIAAGGAKSAPDDHFTAGPNCRVEVSRLGRISRAGGCPGVRAGIVSPAIVQPAASTSAPDDHLTAAPNCCVEVSRIGRISRAGGCPGICAGIVSPAGVKIGAGAISAPDDHLIAGPYCRVIVSAIGRISRAGGCPTIGARIVSPTGIQIATMGAALEPAPDDHFTASPYCRVGRRIRCVNHAGSHPGIFSASSGWVRYRGKSITSSSSFNLAKRSTCFFYLLERQMCWQPLNQQRSR